MTRANTREQEAYLRMAEAFHPPRPIVRNLVVAFWVGGLICVVGQVILDFLLGRGIPQVQAGAMTSTAMVVIGATLTGLGIYDRIGAYAGMGAALPITGFANSMVSPALEFKREGFVLGVSAKMFQIAGPVIVYGSIAAVIVGLFRVFVFK
ncbi:MAG: stage V sporulation protein AC [Bacillota bacterium]